MDADMPRVQGFSQISFSIMLILFILRYPLLFMGEAEIIPTMPVLVVYLLGTYFLAGLFIYLNRKNLMQYNITNTAVLIFLGAPLLALICGNDDDFTLWLRLIMAIALGVLLFRKRRDWLQISRPETGTLILNFLITLLLCFAVPCIVHALRGFPTISAPAGGLPVSFDIPYMFTFQLSLAAVSEEPFFRGILWGYLRARGIHDGWICLIQAGLFWLSHIYYIGTGVNFWIVHPLVALLLGLVIWKTKSITHSMALHASINTFTDYLRHFPVIM